MSTGFDVDEFLSILSHELRNPLNAILGWATIVARTPGLPEPARQGLAAIERNSRIQARLIADLLDYANFSSGKLRLAVETIDPYPAVCAALDEVREAAQAAGATIQSSFAAEGLRIEGDAGRLQQIVRNLLTEAIKVSTPGDTIELTAGRAENTFRLTASDGGRGPAALTRREGTVGLGMALVSQLTELHGGTLRERSADQGLGAAFTLDFPLSRADG
jgi:two-component system CheB/CheR fusion protein